MKKTLHLLLFVAILQAKSYGQQNLKVIIGIVEDVNAMTSVNDVTGKLDKRLEANDFKQNLYIRDNPIFRPGQVLCIRLLQQGDDAQLMLLKDVDPSISVKVSIGAKDTIYTLKELDQLEMQDFYIPLRDFPAIDDFPNKSPVSVAVTITNSPRFVINNPGMQGTLISRIASRWVDYEAFNGNLKKLWFPLFQFSSNLRADENGIPFAAMPINFAFGQKYLNGKSKGYTGFSLIGSYLIFTEPEKSSIPQSSKFNLSTFSAGLLFDFNDIATLGASYSFDVRKDKTDPGIVLVLGFGSGLLSFFK